jgi:hypothetical protein
MKCWNCKQAVEINPLAKLGFRAVCESCNSYLHCCNGCKFYQEGRPNDCMIPGTDPIRDRSASNFCDEFSPIQDVKGDVKKDFNKKFDDLFS